MRIGMDIEHVTRLEATTDSRLDDFPLAATQLQHSRPFPASPGQNVSSAASHVSHAGGGVGGR